VTAGGWEALGTWVGAIGTTGSLIVAIALAMVQLRRHREDEERAQALRVAAWLDISNVNAQEQVRLLARNDSQAYVTDFVGTIVDGLAAGAQPVEEWIAGLRPTGDATVRVTDVPVPAPHEKYRYELTYEFTDARNRRWRHERGKGLFVLAYPAPPPVVFGLDGRPVHRAAGS